uniref:Uncharacterized protein n=1 Tax=Candidatus Nitrotoga fabula TaxID=2182327 RepID=A0A2X0SI98_9PROT|nr:conserved protein of unknown function [Candidatus Nitrotoga fabula]SPS06201.1 conserved protein of unknown function [Candidatus Nitrotoga fabula]
MSDAVDSNTRLDRIESKIDGLSEAVVNLARMEERMITLFKRMDSYDSRQNELNEKLVGIEKTLIGRGMFFQIVDKAAWIVIAAIITVYVTGKS